MLNATTVAPYETPASGLDSTYQLPLCSPLLRTWGRNRPKPRDVAFRHIKRQAVVAGAEVAFLFVIVPGLPVIGWPERKAIILGMHHPSHGRNDTAGTAQGRAKSFRTRLTCRGVNSVGVFRAWSAFDRSF